MSEPRTQVLGGVQFVLTCSACPEQYDLRVDGVRVGYVRMRSGRLGAWMPHPEDRPWLSPEDEQRFAGRPSDAIFAALGCTKIYTYTWSIGREIERNLGMIPDRQREHILTFVAQRALAQLDAGRR